MKVLLVFFDTMRYDHASFNGYSRRTTPVLDDLAREATVFTNCYATDVPTQPCYTATFTGQRGIQTGVVTHGQPEEIIPSHLDTFPAILAKEGILTGAVSTLYRFRRWFAQGFVHYIQPNIGVWLQHVSCEDVNKEAIPWLKAHAHEDFFLFLHYWDPHTPYNLVPKRYLEKFYSGDPYDPSNKSFNDLRSRPLMYFFISGGAVPELREGLTDIEYPVAQYDAEINYADEHFGYVLETLEKEKALDDTIIIFTADHGEALRGEHGVYFDHMDAYEQVAHVPLFIWAPGRVKAQRVSSFVQHTDLAPTILEAFGVKHPESFEGKSLWPILRGESSKHREFVVTNQGLWSAQRAYRTEEWTLVRTYAQGMLLDAPDWELFNRREDPAESRDVSTQYRDVFEELKTRYLEWVDKEVGGKPDPLREEAARSSAANSVKRRFEEWLAAGKSGGRAMTPKDRGDIDDKPA
ncbi:MAG: sulfatase-like hydrolase/transferase [Anaerolineae bacterium]|nr:sulfatase-like hydrolase/transferase [Anaerolineae bacterium]